MCVCGGVYKGGREGKVCNLNLNRRPSLALPGGGGGGRVISPKLTLLELYLPYRC